MNAIDQLATVLSLGLTAGCALAIFSWSLYRLHAMRASRHYCVVTYFRTTIVLGFVVGSFGLGLLDWLVGELEWRPYHSHGAYIVWFFAFIANSMLGALLAIAGRFMLERTMPPNTTPHADARDVPEPASGSSARAGYRER